jgi:hypothetical protein
VEHSGTTRWPSRRDDGRSSTIHSTYYDYYLNVSLYEVTESETA